MRHSTITDNGTLVSLDDPKKHIAVLEAERDKALADMNRNAEIIFELAAERDTLRHKVVEYGQAARRYRRLFDGCFVNRYAMNARLMIIYRLLRRYMASHNHHPGEDCECALCIETRAFLKRSE